MPEKHLDGFWIYELDQEVKINSLTLIDSREVKAQRMSVTNSYFHDGLNCGINLRGAHEVLIANSHSERTRTGGVVAMEDFWWGEGGFPGMLPSLLRTAAFRYLRHCTRALDQLLQWRAAGAVRQLLKRLPPFMEHMQRLEMHTCIHAALSHTPAHGSSHKERGCSETLPHLVTMHVITRHACSRAFPSCDTAAGDVVLRNNTVHNAYYQKDEGPAICAFATGLDDHPSGTPLQPQCPPPNACCP